MGGRVNDPFGLVPFACELLELSFGVEDKEPSLESFLVEGVRTLPPVTVVGTGTWWSMVWSPLTSTTHLVFRSISVYKEW